MELTKDAMQYLHTLGKSENRFIVSPLEPRTFYRVLHDGALEPVTVPLQPLHAKVYTIQSMVEMLNRTCDLEGENGKLPAMILVSEAKAVAIAEDILTYRTNFTLELPKHPVYAILEGLKSTKEYDQRGLVRLLTAQLAGYLDDGEDVAGRIRVIKVEGKSNSSSVMKNGQGGFSQQAYAEAQAENGQKPPESFTVTFPVFDTPDMREFKQTVKVLLEAVVDENGTHFELTTVHDDLARALDNSITELTKKIMGEAEGIPVYAPSA